MKIRIRIRGSGLENRIRILLRYAFLILNEQNVNAFSYLI